MQKSVLEREEDKEGEKMRRCKICEKKHFALGFCRKHYRQLPQVKKKEKEYMRKWSQRPEVQIRVKEYTQLPKVKEQVKLWRKINPEKISEYAKKHKSKRRGLGYEPLNQKFDGSHAHHIDREHIIHTPIELHKSLYHDLSKPETMERINTKVFCWLLIGTM